MKMPVLDTARLRIRPFDLRDLGNLHRILDVELADANFGSEKVPLVAQREEWLRWAILNYEQLARLYQPPYGDRAIVLSATGALIGACGFVPSFGPFGQLDAPSAVANPGPSLNNPELGLFYAVAPGHQHNGYASEAAGALLDYAFASLRLRRVVATTTHENVASMRVMEKIGMRIARNPYPEPPWFQVVGIADNR